MLTFSVGDIIKYKESQPHLAFKARIVRIEGGERRKILIQPLDSRNWGYTQERYGISHTMWVEETHCDILKPNMTLKEKYERLKNLVSAYSTYSTRTRGRLSFYNFVRYGYANEFGHNFISVGIQDDVLEKQIEDYLEDMNETYSTQQHQQSHDIFETTLRRYEDDAVAQSSINCANAVINDDIPF